MNIEKEEEHSINSLKYIIENINVGIIAINNYEEITFINNLACDYIGIKNNENLLRPISEVLVNLPERYWFLRKTLRTRKIINNQVIDWELNGEFKQLLIDTKFIKDKDGEIKGAYLLIKDITELKKMEGEILRQDRLAILGKLAAGSAHELRNPLTAIKGFVQMIAKTLQERGLEKEKRYADIVIAETERMNDIIKQMLLLGKPKETKKENLNLIAIVRDVYDLLANQALLENKEFIFENNLGEELFIFAEADLLKQVILNICKNGLEAVAEKGKVKLTIRQNSGKDKIQIAIQDTGPGIPFYLLDKIFDPFFTTKENGTGLGLAVSQKIINDIGGTIRVSSKGNGTTFIIELPKIE